MYRCSVYLIAVTFLFNLSLEAHAMMTAPQSAPFDRVIANTEAHIEKNPKDSQGYYTMGRIHYIAFWNMADEINIFLPGGSYPFNDEYLDKGGLPSVAEFNWDLMYSLEQTRLKRAKRLAAEEIGFASQAEVYRGGRQEEWYGFFLEYRKQLAAERWSPEKPDLEKMAFHAAEAARNFKRSISLSPDKGLYRLGWASLGEEYLRFSVDLPKESQPELMESITLGDVRNAYYEAFRHALREDLARGHAWGQVRNLVSHEAGTNFLRLSKSESSESRSEKEKVEEVTKALEKLKDIPMLITPIIFSTDAALPLTDLLALDVEVEFDLDGDLRAERWPWVRPETGILVWDPDGEGVITSGRQLFGSATWWMLFPNGYYALDALDDDRDGRLAGAELEGIGLWFDANSNGISEPGEVRPVVECGVRALVTQATGTVDGCPYNETGLEMTDGRILPTYDWVTSPVDDAVTVPLIRMD